MKKLTYLIILLLFSVLISTITFADDPVKKAKSNKKEQKIEQVKKMVEKQNYIFEAQTALPLGAPSVMLTGDYSLTVSKDTIIAFLPYYGVAYSAPLDEDGGIKFICTDFNYKYENTKSGWNIHIDINDTPTLGYKLSLFISESGMANLDINDNTRQSISFNGRVTLKK